MTPPPELQGDPAVPGLPRVYLHPGRLFVSSRPAVVTTVVGSCVAVCLWDTVSQVGGMNHYLLPFRAGRPASPLRFGNTATRRLIQEILALGADTGNLRAKLFGGATIIDSPAPGAGDSLGARNVAIARALLGTEKIAVVAEDVAGSRGRKVLFQTHDGVAWVRKL